MEARLNELLDSIHCRQVLARLKAQGYSDHVAQVGAGGGRRRRRQQLQYCRSRSTAAAPGRVPQPLVAAQVPLAFAPSLYL